MYLTTLPVDQAIGHILRHNLSDPHGHKALPKGRVLRSEDLAILRDLRLEQVRVAVLEPDDVHEDVAAEQLSRIILGAGVHATPAHHSRVNMLAEHAGIVRVDSQALFALNSIDGLTIATLSNHSLVHERQRIATIKVIPFAVSMLALEQAAAIGRAAAQPIVQVDRLRAGRVGVLLVGSAAARQRIERSIAPAIASRVEALGSTILATRFRTPDEAAIAEGLAELLAHGADLLITAGETSIMDRDDVIPLGVRQAGGRIEHYGAPVEPGNLLLLAYIDQIAVLGAPGCVRSRDLNIVDLVLPRLLSGEQLSRHDIIAMGHGGLLAGRGER
jgi:molybdopterin biosynthesis enzyme